MSWTTAITKRWRSETLQNNLIKAMNPATSMQPVVGWRWPRIGFELIGRQATDGWKYLLCHKTTENDIRCYPAKAHPVDLMLTNNATICSMLAPGRLVMHYHMLHRVYPATRVHFVGPTAIRAGAATASPYNEPQPCAMLFDPAIPCTFAAALWKPITLAVYCNGRCYCGHYRPHDWIIQVSFYISNLYLLKSAYRCRHRHRCLWGGNQRHCYHNYSRTNTFEDCINVLPTFIFRWLEDRTTVTGRSWRRIY